MADLTRFYFLRNTILYRPLRALNHRYILRKWRRRGSHFPPPALFKQKLVQDYGRKYSLQTLVETGTAKGKMVQACQDHFHRIISIEYDPGLHQQAKIKFANQSHIILLEGDSGELMAEVLATLKSPALFWLDAHAMIGGILPPKITPIVQELQPILHNPISNHVILIDDARLFIENSEYPSIAEIQALLIEIDSTRSLSVEDDVIRICPG